MGKLYKGQGHWVGQKANPHEFFGFIYVIEDQTTGKAYVGKKQYWVKKPRSKGCKTAVADKRSKRWKSSCWRESDWRTYSGSSKEWNKYLKEHPNHKVVFKILHQCPTRALLHYMEIQEMVDRRVLTTLLPDGSLKYFNMMIPAVKFRPKFTDCDSLKLNLQGDTNG